MVFLFEAYPDIPSKLQMSNFLSLKGLPPPAFGNAIKSNSTYFWLTLEV